MDTTPSLPPEVWEHTPVEAQEYIRVLEARGAMLETIAERLQATVQQLTERVQQDSRTSSRPPSSDPPSAIGKRPRREPSGRRPGGQPGHEGQTRTLVPIEQAVAEPTNNAAERAIRPGVLWRKGSFGTQSPDGSRVVEAMMTVVTTLKQQHRHVLDYLTATCAAALRGEPAPSLLLTPTALAPLDVPRCVADSCR